MTESLVGQRLAQYEVRALLDEGGMAQVYEGFDLNLERRVAIKVLSAVQGASRETLAERFRREARLLAALRHPHIVQIFDYGEQEGHRFIVQELLPGPTLAHWMREQAGPLERESFFEVARQIASGLDAAHEAGIVHRDIKPANLMWNAADKLLLTDFGIARDLQADASITQTGIVLGTPTYLSPEQAKGHAVTPASDLYSFAMILYELLVGRPPFEGDTPMAVVLQHLEQQPPPASQQRPDLPPALDAVFEHALAKEPSQRYPSAHSLVAALEAGWGRAVTEARPAPVDQPTRAWEQEELLAPAPPTDQPTRAWQPVTPPTPPKDEAAPAPFPPPPPSFRRSLPFMLLLALAALILIAGGARYLVVGGEESETFMPIVVATGLPSPTPPLPSPTPPPATPTSLPPTEVPVVLPPTSEPPTVAPSATTTLVPTTTPLPSATPVLTDLLEEIERVVEAGVATGMEGKQGKEVEKRWRELRKKIEEGKSKEAEKTLQGLQGYLLKEVEKGKIDRAFARELLRGLERVAGQYELHYTPVNLAEDDEDD